MGIFIFHVFLYTLRWCKSGLCPCLSVCFQHIDFLYNDILPLHLEIMSFLSAWPQTPVITTQREELWFCYLHVWSKVDVQLEDLDFSLNS